MIPYRFILPALALLCAAHGAAAQDRTRIDPALHVTERLSAGVQAADSARLAESPRAPGPGVPISGRAAVSTTAAGSMVRTLVWLEDGDETVLTRLGAEIGTRAGSIVTARVPLDALPRLAAEPAIRFVEAAAELRPGIGPLPPAATAVPLNDKGTAELGVDRLRRRTGDRFYGLAGHGVIVGIYDSGVDLAHEDFRDGEGKSRVLYAWDQSAGTGRAPGSVGPHTFDYGDECTAADIDAGRCSMTDRSGHGTHVAGTAAGDGSATGAGLPRYRYTGVAPAADLIVVKGGDSQFSTDRLVDGIAYIFARAAELGRPAVVNVSLGSQQGPHDGTTLVEQAIDELVGPGRIVVASAGNEGTNRNESPAFARDPLHAMGTGAGTHALVVPGYEPRAGAANDLAYLELWYEGGDSLTVTVTPPGGEPVRAAPGDSAVVTTPRGSVLAYNAVDGPHATNGDNACILVLFDGDPDAPPAPGSWTIEVEADAVHESGAYHLWLVGSSFQAGTQLARLEGGTRNSHLVSMPASADRVIAVAAYTTRHRWRNSDGNFTYPFQEELGDIASFSSPGPRRDGVLKPAVAAPGKMILSARAQDGAIWQDLAALVEEDGVHAALLGTSMAAPFVTGGIALLLQLDPELTPEEARELLAASARHDEFARRPYTGDPDGVPNPQWGYGKLDVGTATERLRPKGLVRDGERVNLRTNPVRGDELVLNYAERPQRIVVYTFAGERVRTLRGDELGDWLGVWDLTNDAGLPVANGAYLLMVEFADDRVLRKVFVLR